MREGSIAKDVAALAPLLTERTWPCLAFCTDDRNPLEIAEEGHLDFAIRKAIGLGVPPLVAYRAASFGAARAFGLFDRGQIAPGAAPTSSCSTICKLRGRPSDLRRRADRRRRASRTATLSRRSLRLGQARPGPPELLEARASGPSGPVIGAIENSLLTEHLSLAAVQGRRPLARPRAGRAQAVRARAPWQERQRRPRLRQRLRGLARRARRLGRARQPQSDRGRRRRCRHGARREPADRAAGRLRRAQGGRVLAELPLPIAG